MRKQMGKPRRIHLASQCYIRGWALDDHVAVQPNDLSLKPESRTPYAVAWQRDWWGPDAVLSEAAEATLQRAEDASAPILREFADRWPLSRDDRAELSQFMAIHTVRTAAWRQEYNVISMEAIGDELRRRRWGDAVENAAVREFMSDRMRVETLLKQVPRVASLFMSMHWSLVEFDEPLMASCDQPVIFVPRLPSWQRLAIEAFPRAGFMETAEVRFPIDPWRVLLLSWSPQPDLAEPLLGQFRHATDVNRSTRQQADQHWFYRPGVRPPLLNPPTLDRFCAPISYELVSGYSFEVAAASRRRAEADAIMKELIESGTTDLMRFAVVGPSPTDVDDDANVA